MITSGAARVCAALHVTQPGQAGLYVRIEGRLVRAKAAPGRWRQGAQTRMGTKNACMALTLLHYQEVHVWFRNTKNSAGAQVRGRARSAKAQMSSRLPGVVPQAAIACARHTN
jgi:hypothetical protein